VSGRSTVERDLQRIRIYVGWVQQPSQSFPEEVNFFLISCYNIFQNAFNLEEEIVENPSRNIKLPPLLHMDVTFTNCMIRICNINMPKCYLSL